MIYLDMEDENENNSVSDGEGITYLSGDKDSGEKLEWNDIKLVGEFHGCVPATIQEKKKALNTISRRKIKLQDIGNWKNKEWNKLPKMIKDFNGSEYEVLKEIVKEIINKRNEMLEIKGQENDEEMTINNGQTQVTKERHTEDNSDIKNNRVDNPKTSGESLPTENSEWTIVGKGQGVR